VADEAVAVDDVACHQVRDRVLLAALVVVLHDVAVDGRAN
jgi:hypothetical protein